MEPTVRGFGVDPGYVGSSCEMFMKARLIYHGSHTTKSVHAC